MILSVNAQRSFPLLVVSNQRKTWAALIREWDDSKRWKRSASSFTSFTITWNDFPLTGKESQPNRRFEIIGIYTATKFYHYIGHFWPWHLPSAAIALSLLQSYLFWKQRRAHFVIRSDSIVRPRMIVVITVPACVLEFVLVGGRLFPLQIRLLSGMAYTRARGHSLYHPKKRKKNRVTIENEKVVSNTGNRYWKYRRYRDCCYNFCSQSRIGRESYRYKIVWRNFILY